MTDNVYVVVLRDRNFGPSRRLVHKRDDDDADVVLDQLREQFDNLDWDIEKHNRQNLPPKIDQPHYGRIRSALGL